MENAMGRTYKMQRNNANTILVQKPNDKRLSERET
jgi:hypothetical protein